VAAEQGQTQLGRHKPCKRRGGVRFCVWARTWQEKLAAAIAAGYV
jgi:hypothetical protein